MNVRCVVACRDANGDPALFPCEVACTPEEFVWGRHYGRAEHAAGAAGYDTTGSLVVFDEKGGPAWLFERFFPVGTHPDQAARGPVRVGDQHEQSEHRVVGAEYRVVGAFVRDAMEGNDDGGDPVGFAASLADSLAEHARDLAKAIRALKRKDGV